MYVRDAKNREEVWLLDRLEELGLDETAFRSRDYVVAIDEESHEKAGFGRIRIHKTDDAEICELTSIGVLPVWRDQGVGAHVVERLVEYAGDQGFERVYALADEPGYFVQFGFERIADDALPPRLQERLETKREDLQPDAESMVVDVAEFTMPDRLRDRFKSATPQETTTEDDETEAEDFGIDSDEATYKYDI